MSYLWSLQEESLLKQNKDKDIEEIEDLFNKKVGGFGFPTKRTRKSIYDKLRRLEDDADILSSDVVMDKRIQEMKDYNDKVKLEEVPSFLPKDGKERFILSLSDLHIPFAPIERIVSILEDHKDTLKSDKVKSCIMLNGDIMDQYAASMFPKSKEIAMIKEYQMSMNLVDICLDYTDHVFMTRGNHEKRLSRSIKEKLPGPVANMFQTDLLARIANGEIIGKDGMTIGFANNFKGRVHYQVAEPWYMRIGKTIFAHASAYKSGPGATVAVVASYLSKRYDRNEFDCVVHGHTHCLYKGIVANRLLIEQGSLCGRLDYEHDDHLKFGSSQNGYAYIWQDKNGNTNFNDSNIVYIGSMLPKKKGMVW